MQIKLSILFPLLLLLGTVLSLGVSNLSDRHLNIQPKFQMPGTSRTLAVAELCSPYSSRSELVDQQALQSAKDLRNSVNSSVGIDGLVLFKLLAEGKDSQAGRMVTDNLASAILFGLQFGFGLILLLLIWPCLLCCCLCHCCVRSYNRKVSKGLLITLVIALSLAIGSSIYGLVETLKVGDSIQKAGCSAAIVPDDILFGNLTSNGRQFFTGFFNIAGQVGELQANLDNIANNFSILVNGSSNPTIENALSLCQTAKTAAVKISNNDLVGSPLVLQYPTPINQSLPTSSVPSIFPGLLGSTSTRTGLVWSIYSALDALNQQLLSLRSSASNYNSQIGNISRDITPIQDSASQIITDIQDSDKTISDHLPQVKNWINTSNLSVKIYYGLVIFCGVVGILAAFCLTKSFLWKIVLHTACVILFYTAAIGFTVAFVFSFALPPLVWSCAFIEDSMVNAQTFATNFNFLVDNQTLSDISVCMPFGDGNILSKIGVDSVAGINNLTAVLEQLNSFNISAYRQSIEGNMSIGLSSVRDFASARILDLSDTNSLSVLGKIAQPSQAGYQNCNGNLQGDSWVPSDYPNPQYPSISCTSKGGGIGNETTCPNGVASLGLCQGCMDSSQILNFYQRSPSSDLNADLGVRYGSACSFNQELQNIWKNYYQIKANALGPDVQGSPSVDGVLSRTMAVKSDIDSLISQVDPALPNLFSNVLTGLSTISSIVDPKTGLLAGLNCRLMGQDFQRLEQSVCGRLFLDIYATRLAMGIASYGILLSLCVFSCLAKYRKRESIAYVQESGQQPQYYAMNTSEQSYQRRAYQ